MRRGAFEFTARRSHNQGCTHGKNISTASKSCEGEDDLALPIVHSLFSPLGPQCSVWLFSAFSVLNSEKEQHRGHKESQSRRTASKKCMHAANISTASNTRKMDTARWGEQ